MVRVCDCIQVELRYYDVIRLFQLANFCTVRNLRRHSLLLVAAGHRARSVSQLVRNVLDFVQHILQPLLRPDGAHFQLALRRDELADLHLALGHGLSAGDFVLDEAGQMVQLFDAGALY